MFIQLKFMEDLRIYQKEFLKLLHRNEYLVKYMKDYNNPESYTGFKFIFKICF